MRLVGELFDEQDYCHVGLWGSSNKASELAECLYSCLGAQETLKAPTCCHFKKMGDCCGIWAPEGLNKLEYWNLLIFFFLWLKPLFRLQEIQNCKCVF